METSKTVSTKIAVIINLVDTTDYFKTLTNIVKYEKSNDLPENIWIHLSHFLELIPSSALDQCYFNFFWEKLLAIDLEHNGVIILKCFGFILQCGRGQEEFDRHDGIRLFYDLLHNKNLKSHEYVIFCLQNGTVSKRAIIRCCAFWDLPWILTLKAQNKTNDRMQLYCLQVRSLIFRAVMKKFSI